MLVNFPFLPETQETVDEWIQNLKNAGYTDEKIKEANISTHYHIPDNLTKDDTGLDDNTGLYYPKMDLGYQSVQLEDGFKIEAFDDFMPVMLVENRRDQDYPYDEWDKEYIEADSFKITKEIMLGRNYGFVLSFDDFFNLIGNQLKDSSRKFAVSFSLHEYYYDIFHKRGRLYHPDHTQYDLKDGDPIYSFHIYELIEEDSFQIKEESKLAFFSEIIHSDSHEQALIYCENSKNEAFVTHLLKEREKELKRG